MVAGELFVRIGKMVAEGKPITDSTQIEGMGKMRVDSANHTLFGDSLESLDKDNMQKLIKMGL
jgi:hypothetical protein